MLGAKLSGRYKIVGYDIETGKERLIRDWKYNRITNQPYEALASTSPPGRAIDSSQVEVYLLNAGLTQADFVPPSIPTSQALSGRGELFAPVASEDSDPRFMEFSSTYAPNGATETFDLVMVSVGPGTFTFVPPVAYDVLDPVCTRGPQEVVNIFYQIFLDTFGLQENNLNFLNAGVDTGLVIFRSAFGLPSPPRTIDYRGSRCTWFERPTNETLRGYSRLEWSSFGRPRSLGDFRFDVATLGSPFFKQRFTRAIAQDLQDTSGARPGNGDIVCTVAKGSYTAGSLQTLQEPIALDRQDNSQEPQQRVFGHAANAPGPFFSAGAPATGRGQVNISLAPGGWQKVIPTIYAISIVDGGSATTATFRLLKKTCLGFEGENNWRAESISPNPWRHPAEEGPAPFLRTPVPYSDRQVLTQEASLLSVINIFDGSFDRWDASTTPAYVYDARQIEARDGFIYIADPGAGLFVLDEAAGAISGPVGGEAACYGVEVSENGTVYWLADSGLRQGTGDLSDAVTTAFAYPGTNTGANARFIKVNKAVGRDNEIAVILRDADNSNQETVFWFDVTTGTTTTGPSNTQNGTNPALTSSYRLLQTNSVIPSQDGTIWYFLSSRDGNALGSTRAIGFGEASQGTRLLGVSPLAPPGALGPDYGRCGLVSWRNAVLNDRGLVTVAGSSTVTVYDIDRPTSSVSFRENSYRGQDVGCVLPDGTLVTGNAILPINRGLEFSPGNNFWDELGWNGSEWVLGHPGVQTASTGLLDLVDGLQVSFADGPSGTSFVAGNYYTVQFCYGIQIDTRTALQLEYDIYHYPTAEAADPPKAIPANLSLAADAASSDGFIGVDNDERTILRANVFLIDGVPVTAILQPGQTPAPGQCTLAYNGDATFAAADEDKTFERLRYIAFLEENDPDIGAAIPGQVLNESSLTVVVS